MGAALGEPGCVSAVLRPGGLLGGRHPGGPFPGNLPVHSTHSKGCTPGKRAASADKSPDPTPVSETRQKGRLELEGVPQMRPIHRGPGPGARGAETQACGDALGATHPPRPGSTPN